MPFVDRAEAGQRLAERLRRLAGGDIVVLGLPRGGVPVAFEVARELGAPLDVVVVRKLGVPFQPELAMGAVGEDGALVLNRRVLRSAHVSDAEVAESVDRARAEVERRAQRFRGSLPRIPVAGRTVVLIDDGMATGATARAACEVVRAQGAARVVLGVPVAPRSAVRRLDLDVDELVCLETPTWFVAVGQFYADFGQVSDREVVELLRRAGRRAAADATTGPAADGPVDEDVEVAVGAVRLSGHLTIPAGARGLVVFAHGSGSSRHSPRNHHVASVLNRHGLGTLLFDLLSPAEELDRAAVFDIGLQAGRLADVAAGVRARPECRHLPIGFFGASTGAAAALRAAADDPDVSAVVSRGGRPDLAGAQLAEVRAPTLLIVGGDDRDVLELNRQAQRVLRCPNRLAVVPGATHLFEEPGMLDRVADLAADWFAEHLVQPVGAASR